MHTLIAGTTMSGKTTLARDMARRALARGENVIVRDPMGTATAGGDWGEKAVVFAQGEDDEFWEYVQREDVRNAHIIVDEAADFFAVGQTENQWLLRGGRHFGFAVVLIAQRPKMIAPNARAQCGQAYLFRLCRDDMREILGDFGHNYSDEPFQKVLDSGDYVHVKGGSAAIARGNIFRNLNRKTQS